KAEVQEHVGSELAGLLTVVGPDAGADPLVARRGHARAGPPVQRDLPGDVAAGLEQIELRQVTGREHAKLPEAEGLEGPIDVERLLRKLPGEARRDRNVDAGGQRA